MDERLRVWEYKDADLDLLVAQASNIDGAHVVDGVCMRSDGRPFQPSKDWAQGGPILAKEKISVWCYPDLQSWHACTGFDFVRGEGLKTQHYCQGPTPLVAAMRSFAASKLWLDPKDRALAGSSPSFSARPSDKH